MPDWKARLDSIVANGYPENNLATVMDLPVIVSWEEGHVHNVWEVKKKYFTIGDSLFGGYICALADQMAAHTALTVLPNDMIARTVELSTTFFRRVSEGKLRMDGRVVSQSKRVVHCEIVFHDDENVLVARANAIVFKDPLGPPEQPATPR